MSIHLIWTNYLLSFSFLIYKLGTHRAAGAGLRQENDKFKTILGNLAKAHLKIKTIKEIGKTVSSEAFA